jgi:flavodoxin
MSDYLIFFSSRGNQAKVVSLEILNHIGLPLNKLIDVSLINCVDSLDFDHAIFVCPTYGDEELEVSMERFIVELKTREVPSRTFSVIELGLYRGYDVPRMGAARLISGWLRHICWVERAPALSLDSVNNDFFMVLKNWLEKYYKND